MVFVKSKEDERVRREVGVGEEWGDEIAGPGPGSGYRCVMAVGG